MQMNIKKFADLTGVSVRTLRYYDEIELLKPDFVDQQTGYRYYSENSIYKMQEILFYRELDFSLQTIKKLIFSPNYNKEKALSVQKELLLLKKERLEKIIEVIESVEKGEKIMNFNVFNNNEFEKIREFYKDEVNWRWGKTTAYKEHIDKTLKYSNEKWTDVAEGINNILSEFSTALKNGLSYADERVCKLVIKLQNFITETQYTCTDEILFSLAEMYVRDERFKNNIDKNGKGTAEFISNAVKNYLNK